jgi:hypothetical protein
MSGMTRGIFGLPLWEARGLFMAARLPRNRYGA